MPREQLCVNDLQFQSIDVALIHSPRMLAEAPVKKKPKNGAELLLLLLSLSSCPPTCVHSLSEQNTGELWTGGTSSQPNFF